MLFYLFIFEIVVRFKEIVKETKSTYKLAIRNHTLKTIPSHVIPHVIPHASETSQHTGSIGGKKYVWIAAEKDCCWMHGMTWKYLKRREEKCPD